MSEILCKIHLRWKFIGIVLFLLFFIFLVIFVGLIFDVYKLETSSDLNRTQNLVKDKTIVTYSLNQELVIGNNNAKLIVVEYFDYQCPFCEKYYKHVYPKIYENYVQTGYVKYVFKHYPLMDLHYDAFNIALAIECSKEQSSALDYRDEILKYSSFPDTLIKVVATDIGLNINQFSSCYDSRKYEDIVYSNMKEAKNLNVELTPTVVVGDEIVQGLKPYSYYKRVIDRELKRIEAYN